MTLGHTASPISTITAYEKAHQGRRNTEINPLEIDRKCYTCHIISINITGNDEAICPVTTPVKVLKTLNDRQSKLFDRLGLKSTPVTIQIIATATWNIP